ncbi:hypothetical protein V498_08402 [Pseudogymnoascus sp. VKM F-4517 (FW-2822)]|nr:hypothetical protein V498_08402 [Pseudogymnoascus sp. VKM F-4517 (FW-2822)]
MRLTTVLVPLSALLTLVAAHPAAAEASVAISSASSAEAVAQSGFEDDSDIKMTYIAIPTRSSSDSDDTLFESSSLDKRDVLTHKCGTGKQVDMESAQFFAKFLRSQGNQEPVCLDYGYGVTWPDGPNRYKLVNRTLNGTGNRKCYSWPELQNMFLFLRGHNWNDCPKKSVWAHSHTPEAFLSQYKV